MRRIGIWASNGRNDSVQQMYSWRPGAVTTFIDYIGDNQVIEHVRQNPGVIPIVRFQLQRDWHTNVAEAARFQASYVLSKWDGLKEINPYIYYANELNLHYENGDDNPGNQYLYETPGWYLMCSDFIRMTADIIKQQVPTMRLVCPPYAFGHHEDGAPDDDGNIKEPWAGYDYLADTIRTHFDAIFTFHAYWGNLAGSDMNMLYDPEISSWYAFRWQRVLKMFKKRYNIDAKVIIDEAGNFAASDEDFTDQVIYYGGKCLMHPAVLAVTFFLWFDPTNSPGNVPNSWIQRCQNLSEHVYRLGEMPDVEIEYPPEDPGNDEVTIRVLVGDEVQALELNDYLEGVVPCEMGALQLRVPTDPTRLNVYPPPGVEPDPYVVEDTHFQALIWQAMAAKAYAEAMIEDPRSDIYDVVATADDQVYNPSKKHWRSTEAVARIRDIHLLTKDGNPYKAQYISGCGLPLCKYCNGFGGYKSQPWPGRGCQFGAQRMANLGYTWRDIIHHYYPDAVISDEVDDPPEGEDMTELYRTFAESSDVLDPNLERHSWPSGMVIGSVARIVPADVAWARWGHPDAIVPGSLYWKVRGAKLIDEAQSKGDTNIYVRFLDQQGVPVAAAACWHGYPSSKLSNDNWVGKFDNGGGNGDLFVYATGNGAITQGKNSFLGVEEGSETIGPYCYSGHNHPTEMLVGFGLTNNHHISGTIDFQLAVWGSTEPNPDPDPDPDPGTELPGCGGWIVNIVKAIFRI